MDKNARQFARRILLVHGLLLVVVLATVIAAAREIYTTTRDQLVKEAIQRQQQLTRQTASGISSHYQSILNDMDLLRRVENDETGAAKPSTQPTDEVPAIKRLAPPENRLQEEALEHQTVEHQTVEHWKTARGTVAHRMNVNRQRTGCREWSASHRRVQLQS